MLVPPTSIQNGELSSRMTRKRNPKAGALILRSCIDLRFLPLATSPSSLLIFQLSGPHKRLFTYKQRRVEQTVYLELWEELRAQLTATRNSGLCLPAAVFPAGTETRGLRSCSRSHFAVSSFKRCHTSRSSKGCCPWAAAASAAVAPGVTPVTPTPPAPGDHVCCHLPAAAPALSPPRPLLSVACFSPEQQKSRMPSVFLFSEEDEAVQV